MIELIRSEIESSGAAPEQIAFEVTETVAAQNLDKATTFIQAIRALGCHILLDDFGG